MAGLTGSVPSTWRGRPRSRSRRASARQVGGAAGVARRRGEDPGAKPPPRADRADRSPTGRGVIAVQGGADGPFKAAVAHLQDGLKRATGTTLPVVQEAKPGPAVILGDLPQTAAEGLKSEHVPAGGFEIRTLKERVLIVGDAAGVLHGVEAFLPTPHPARPTGLKHPGDLRSAVPARSETFAEHAPVEIYQDVFAANEFARVPACRSFSSTVAAFTSKAAAFSRAVSISASTTRWPNASAHAWRAKAWRTNPRPFCGATSTMMALTPTRSAVAQTQQARRLGESR